MAQESKSTETATVTPADRISESRQTVNIDGRQIDYVARAGTLVLREETESEDKATEGEKPKASIFFISYTKVCDADAEEPKSARCRPITFSFNGGPGSSSVWLHLGLLGPRRVRVTGTDNQPLPPPHRLEDNLHSVLDLTDLVFIDPVSTGYSRAIEGEKASRFHDFKKDIEAVGEFIRLYATRFERWSSPKFLIGESYGTTRAAGLSGYLQDRHGLYLNGIMLISTILNFQTASFAPGNDLPIFSSYPPTRQLPGIIASFRKTCSETFSRAWQRWRPSHWVTMHLP